MPEQDVIYQLRDVERQLERLDRDFENFKKDSGARIERAQERVQGLETTRTVLVAVAAIFGVAGSWGFVTLQTAQSKISGIQAQVEQLEKGTKAVFEAEQQAVSQANQDIQVMKERQLDDFNMRTQQAAPRLQAQLNELKQWTDYIYTSAGRRFSNEIVLGNQAATDHKTLVGLENWQGDLVQQSSKVSTSLNK